jgi:serine/threonine protein phosphatase 1
MTTVTYAIGDIHGRRDLLDRLLDSIEADATARGARAKIVFTGDYVDRGADSFGVIERLIAGPRRPGDAFVCLRGNHDALFVQAITLDHGLPNWAWMLYWHTLLSYGLTRETRHANDRELRRHAAFLAALPLTHDDGTFFFVHAGIRPGVPLDEQTDEDLLWIRAEFLTHTGPLPRRVVHGHTIMGDDPVVTDNRISIDTGAFRSGILTAAVLDGSDISFLQAVGAPDRGAIVREAILHEAIHGRTVTPALEAIHADYLAGRIDLPTMEARSQAAIKGAGS